MGETIITQIRMGMALVAFLLAELEFIGSTVSIIEIIQKKKDRYFPQVDFVFSMGITVLAMCFILLITKGCWTIYIYVAIGVLLINCLVYAIICIKMVDAQGVFHFMASILFKIFKWVDKVICWAEKRGSSIKYVWLLVYGMIPAMLLGNFFGAPAYLTTLIGLVELFLMFWLFIWDYRGQCGKLFLIELLAGIVFALTVCAEYEKYFQETVRMSGYLIFVLFYTAFFIFTILFANDDPAKLALNILNTMTTLVTIIFNIGILMMSLMREGQQGSLLFSSNEINGMALLVNLILLPFLSAGYVSLLFKEMQVYWRKKYL